MKIGLFSSLALGMGYLAALTSLMPGLPHAAASTLTYSGGGLFVVGLFLVGMFNAEPFSPSQKMTPNKTETS